MIAGKEEGVRDLPAKATRHMNELRESNDGRARHRQTFGTDDTVRFRLDDFRLPVNYEPERPTHGYHGQGLERRVQRQTTDDQSPSGLALTH